MTIPELILIVSTRIPYPAQITELETKDETIRFTWRGERFQIDTNLFVETVEGCCLAGSNVAILLQALLKSKP